MFLPQGEPGRGGRRWVGRPSSPFRRRVRCQCTSPGFPKSRTDAATQSGARVAAGWAHYPKQRPSRAGKLPSRRKGAGLQVPSHGNWDPQFNVGEVCRVADTGSALVVEHGRTRGPAGQGGVPGTNGAQRAGWVPAFAVHIDSVVGGCAPGQHSAGQCFGAQRAAARRRLVAAVPQWRRPGRNPVPPGAPT